MRRKKRHLCQYQECVPNCILLYTLYSINSSCSYGLSSIKVPLCSYWKWPLSSASVSLQLAPRFDFLRNAPPQKHFPCYVCTHSSFYTQPCTTKKMQPTRWQLLSVWSIRQSTFNFLSIFCAVCNYVNRIFPGEVVSVQFQTLPKCPLFSLWNQMGQIILAIYLLINVYSIYSLYLIYIAVLNKCI